jgi:hypothetical protein
MYGKIWIVDSPQQNCEHPRTLTGKVCDTVSTRSLDISGNCTVIVWIFRKEFHEILRHQIEFKASKELRHLDHDHFRSLRPSCLCRCSDLRSKIRYQRVSGFRPLRGKQDSVKFLGKTNCAYRQLNPCLSVLCILCLIRLKPQLPRIPISNSIGMVRIHSEPMICPFKKKQSVCK